jgi:hypothetical protein
VTISSSLMSGNGVDLAKLCVTYQRSVVESMLERFNLGWLVSNGEIDCLY